MRRPDVETLMAYANGSLTPEEAHGIERFLEGDSEVRRLIEAYQRVQTLTPAAFEAPMQEVRRRHRSDPVMPSSAGADAMAPTARTARRFTRGLAASLVVIAGLGFGAFLLGQEQEEESPIALGRLSTIDALSAALTRLTTGTPDMAGDRAMTVLTTFRDAALRPCRKFELSDTSPTVSLIIAVACHDDGAWWIEGAAWLKTGGSGSSYDSAPATSEPGADALAGVLGRLGAGGALAHEDEAALIARDWHEEPAK